MKTAADLVETGVVAGQPEVVRLEIVKDGHIDLAVFKQLGPVPGKGEPEREGGLHPVEIVSEEVVDAAFADRNVLFAPGGMGEVLRKADVGIRKAAVVGGQVAGSRPGPGRIRVVRRDSGNLIPDAERLELLRSSFIPSRRSAWPGSYLAMTRNEGGANFRVAPGIHICELLVADLPVVYVARNEYAVPEIPLERGGGFGVTRRTFPETGFARKIRVVNRADFVAVVEVKTRVELVDDFDPRPPSWSI